MTIQMYAVRATTQFILPNELAPVVSIHASYAEASAECDDRQAKGQSGAHVTTYSCVSTLPTN